MLRDAQGHGLFIPAACDGTSCTQYAADIGSPGFRAWWISNAQNQMAKGYKGIFVDDVNMEMRVSNGAGQDVRPIDPRTGAPMTDTNWRRYIAEFTEAIRAGLPNAQITHNAQWWVDQSDPYVQREIDSANVIELERGFNDGGLTQGGGMFGYQTFMNHIEWIHSRGKSVVSEPYNLDSAKREYEMASLYLVKAANDGISSDYQADPQNWWSGWQTDLGAPQGNRYQWNGLWRRDFAKGFVLTNEPGTQSRTVQLGGSYTRLSSGSQVSSVTLGAASGAVLIASSPPRPSPPAPTTYSLTVSTTGSGTVAGSGINCPGGGCSASYNDGTQVTLTESPASGYSFSRWGGPCSGSASTCTVTMSAAKSVSAAFSADPPPSDPMPSGTDLARNMPTTSMSVEGVGLTASEANDGNSSTRWSSAFADNQWWQVDLGSARQVDTVSLNWETAYASQYRILTSTDGASFSHAADVTNSSAGVKTNTFSVRSARYVRILGVTRATPYGFSFWDAQVYGPSSSPPPSDPPPTTTPPVVTTTHPPTTSSPSVNHAAKSHHKKLRPKRKRRA